MDRRRVIGWIAFALLSGILLGFGLGALVPPLVFDDAFRREFFTSPGFGGLAALLAALVADAARSRSSRPRPPRATPRPPRRNPAPLTKEGSMAEQRQAATDSRAPSPSTPVYRSLRTGRIVSQAQRIAAAKTRIVADDLRGVETAPWIVELSKQSA